MVIAELRQIIDDLRGRDLCHQLLGLGVVELRCLEAALVSMSKTWQRWQASTVIPRQVGQLRKAGET